MFLFERKLASSQRDTEPRTYVNKLFVAKINTKNFYKYFFEVNFYSVLIFFCKYLEIYTKTISRLRFGDYKPIIHFAFGSVNMYR